jgi:formate hydrogenlyase transcriptional activator
MISSNNSVKTGISTFSGVSAEELIAFERMLADLSARFANVLTEQVEIEIQTAQIMLRQFLGFDRSTFGEFRDDGPLVVLSSSAVEGFEPTPIGPLPVQLSWFIGQLRAGNTIITPNTAVNLPPEAVAETEYARRTGLISHLAIPLRIGGHIVGAIAFSAFRATRVWPEDLIARLKLVGEVNPLAECSRMSLVGQRTNPLPREGAAARSGALLLPQ